MKRAKYRAYLTIDNFMGALWAILGIAVSLFVLFYQGSQDESLKLNAGGGGDGGGEHPELPAVPMVEVGMVSANQLQERLDSIERTKQAIEEARLAEIRAREEEKRRQEEEKRRKEEEKKRQEELRKKALEEKKKAEEKKRKEALEKKRQEEKKAKEEKEKQEKAEKEKAEKQAEKERKKKAEEAKKLAQAQKAKLDKIAPVEKIGTLSSFEGLGGGGNSIAGGVGGTGSKAMMDALAAFGDLVGVQVRRYWKLPPELPNDQLSAQLLIKFNEKGEVVSVKVTQSSGYPIFDNSAIAAIKRASPLTLPDHPQAVAAILQEGMLFNFRP